MGYGCQTFSPRLAAGSSFSQPRVVGDRNRQVIQAGGILGEDTIWDADTVRVIEDVTIPNGSKLSIPSGVAVVFEGHFALHVQGTIRALGRATEPILFTSASPELFSIDSTTAGTWFGLRFDQTAATNDSSRLDYCIIEYCKAAGDGSRGAALSLTGFSKLRVSNCTFRYNVADVGAVAYCANFASPNFVNCLMTDNYAFVSGSAVHCLDAYPGLSNSTIVFNHVLNEEIFDEAGAIHNHLSKSRPVNCIIRDNSSHYFLGGQIREPKLYYTIYNNIEGGHPGEGNFDDDPLFVGDGSHPYALQPDSPCVERGNPQTAGLHLTLFDLAGHSRLYDPRIDVGAYEWVPVAGVPDHPVVDEGQAAGRGVISFSASPNPCRIQTDLRLDLMTRATVRVWVADASGRRIVSLFDGDLAAGAHTFDWSPQTLARGSHRPIAGVYWGVVRVAGKDIATLEPASVAATRIVVVP